MYTTHRNSQKSREAKKNKKTRTKTKKKGRRVEESRRNTPSVKRPKDHWRKKTKKTPTKQRGPNVSKVSTDW